MLRLRSVFRSTLKRAAITVCAAVAAATVSGLIQSSAAVADDLPFWEREDAAKSKSASAYKAKKSSYASQRSKTKKSYASSSSKKLGGYAEQTEPVKHKKRGVKVAALGGAAYSDEKPKKSLSGGGVNWTASSGCLDPTLKAVIYQVASNYGSLRVNSTCRSAGHNRAVGGAPRSKHLSGDAVDFRVFGNVGAVYAYLKSSGSVGGLKHYGGGLFHIDNGERRSW